MTGRVIGAGVITCLAIAAAVESGQARFEATDRSEMPGLRIINVRDNALKTCYAVFVAQTADPVDAGARIEFTEIGRAAAARDQRLTNLVSAFEQERAAIPGTPAPDALKYDWQADTAQIDFALAALNNMFARLAQDLLRASRTAITVMPQTCAPAGRVGH